MPANNYSGLGMLIGGGLGAGIGAIHAGKGHRLEGALGGGIPGVLLGHSVGGLAGLASDMGAAGRARSSWAPPRSAWSSYEDPFAGFGGGRSGGGFGGGHAAPRAQGLGAVAPWMKDVGSQAEAKAAFRAQARANHPDVGGSTANMQNINAQWEAAQKHPDFANLKTAFDAGRRAARERFMR